MLADIHFREFPPASAPLPAHHIADLVRDRLGINEKGLRFQYLDASIHVPPTDVLSDVEVVSNFI